MRAKTEAARVDVIGFRLRICSAGRWWHRDGGPLRNGSGRPLQYCQHLLHQQHPSSAFYVRQVSASLRAMLVLKVKGEGTNGGGECSAYSSLQADSKVKFAAWPTSWRPPGTDRLLSRWSKVNSRIWLVPYRAHYKYRPEYYYYYYYYYVYLYSVTIAAYTV